jgi:hypothetical protein
MKQVVFETKLEVVNVDDCKKENIYIMKTKDAGIFKLHKIPMSSGYFWLSLCDSSSGWNGAHCCFKDALLSVEEQQIIEFESMAVFKEWLVEEVPQ